MTDGLSTRAESVTWRYAAIGTTFGLLFPVAALAMLLASGSVPWQPTVLGFLAAAHEHSPLLYVIDTAPLFLGVFAAATGVRQTELIALNASLEQKVAAKTAALREALQQAEKTNALISHMADHDPLTGLLNRRRMHKEIVAAVSHARRYPGPFALIFVDLDRFKAINDNHGHEAGDRLLRGFASLLEQLARDTDEVGRWGGDEFVILLPNASRPQAAQLVARLKTAVDGQPIDIGAVRLPASASFGVAVHPDDGSDPESLIAHADQAMYRVKRIHDCAAGVDQSV